MSGSTCPPKNARLPLPPDAPRLPPSAPAPFSPCAMPCGSRPFHPMPPSLETFRTQRLCPLPPPRKHALSSRLVPFPLQETLRFQQVCPSHPPGSLPFPTGSPIPPPPATLPFPAGLPPAALRATFSFQWPYPIPLSAKPSASSGFALGRPPGNPRVPAALPHCLASSPGPRPIRFPCWDGPPSSSPPFSPCLHSSCLHSPRLHLARPPALAYYKKIHFGPLRIRES